MEQEANIDTNEGVFEVPIPQSYNMASVFRLENFKGDSSQDIRSFLKRFEQYKGCTGINEEQGLATLAWHLDGTARLWFESLDPQPTTENRLKEALMTKFVIDRPLNMNIYSMKQENCESAQDFLRRLECEVLKSGNKVSSEVQVQIALNGMDRAIGSAISTHAPKDLDEVKRLCNRMGCVRQDASVAQATLPSKLEAAVDVLTATMAQLSSKLEDRTTPQKRWTPQETNSQECSRCGGRCFSSSSCRAMGKTCYKCKKLNHFGNKCRGVRVTQNGQQGQVQHYNSPRSSNRSGQNYGYHQ